MLSHKKAKLVAITAVSIYTTFYHNLLFGEWGWGERMKKKSQYKETREATYLD